MKKVKVLLFVTVASLFAACNDAIDITQPSELLPEDTYQTVQDMQLGLNGVYLAVPGEDHIKFTSLFTDEVKLGISNGGQGRSGELGFVLNNTSDDARAIWVNNYYLINLANRLIEGAKNVVPSEEESVAYNSIVGQAHFLRAFGHFQLLTFFSPDLTKDDALGVIKVDFVPTTDMALPRSTNAEVFELINSDLEFAENSINDAFVNGTYVNKSGATSPVIKAFRARMALYRGQYDLAGSYVDALASGGNAANLTLATKGASFTSSNYVKMFIDTDISEIVWKLQRAIDDGTGNFYQVWSSVSSRVNGSPFYEVGTALFDKMKSTDIRRLVVVDSSAAPSYTIRPVGKYSGRGRNQNLLGDIKVFRNSEMVLIRAEVYANNGDFTNVAAMINKIRRVRHFNGSSNNTGEDIAVPTSAQEAWAAILNERRIELAFEGHRYIDIKRIGPKANASVDRAQSDFLWNEQYTISNDDYRFTLPIPRDEQAANPGIQQNPGYGGNQ